MLIDVVRRLLLLLLLSYRVSAFSAGGMASKRPKLIVFDLDNTLWTPELYQLRKQKQGGHPPIAGSDVQLFPGAKIILDRIRENAYGEDTRFAIASRTKSINWAFSLLDDFGIADLFDHMEIFPASKLEHFCRLKEDSGIPYSEMLFFDDARDGKFGNCVPVANLGVLAVHCPTGLHSESVFDRALDYFAEKWDRSPGVVLSDDGSVPERKEGYVKYVNAEKRYGFIIPKGQNKGDVFFHFNSLATEDTVVKGDVLSYCMETNSKTGKDRAVDVQVKSSSAKISYKAFSMGMPFAALLANGYKTLESRNNDVFLPCIAGTQLLIHVGRKTFDDGDSHLDIMKRDDLPDDDIAKLKSLPKGCDRGMIVAVCEVGSTDEMMVAQRTDPKVERKIVALGRNSGKFVTEIRRVGYLKQPIPFPGKPGIFPVSISRDNLPDNWQPPTPAPTNYAPKKQTKARPNTKLVYSISSD